MKIFNMVFAFLLLLISTNVFSFESYDYTPYDDNEYYSGDENDDNYSSSYGNRREQNTRNDKYQYSNRSKKISSNGFTGAGKLFIFDPKELRWYAYYNGSLINSGPASGGKFYCPDIRRGCKTPAGVFHIGHKGGPDCKSSKYPVGKGNAPMPWCMFFHRGFAIHGGMVPNYNASHGCIRVPHSDARWLNMNFLTPGSKVIVKSYR